MKKMLVFLISFLLIVPPCFATYKPFKEAQTTAFGETSVAELSPVVQLQFPYNVNTRLVNTNTKGGSVTISDNKVVVATGAAANRFSQLLSRVGVHYSPGQGSAIRFTALLTSGTANSTQYIGIGDAGDGYFFGFNGSTFGILRRSGGSVEIQTLTITTASSDAEDITITLNGNAKSDVTVTASGVKETTAREVAAEDYSAVGDGWNAKAVGDTVLFISFNAEVKASTFSLSSATSAVGGFAESVAGVAPTNTVINQSSWSEDVMDGSGASGITLDQTKGNVYQIQYQWLGFGAIEFSIENPSNGEFVLVHRIQYANANTVPSVNNPTLPMCIAVENTSNTSDISISSSSMAGFIEGKEAELGILEGAENNITTLSTTELPLLTIRNKDVYQGKLNRTRIEPLYLALATESTKPVIFRIRLNTTLTGSPAFSDIDASNSIAAKDVAASGISGGSEVFTTVLGKADSEIIDFTSLKARLNPGEQITITGEATSGANQEVTVSLTWKELF